MAIEQIEIGKFVALWLTAPVLDVRSPGEFLHAHMPGARSFPLFDDEQRRVIGTTYKQKSRQEAVMTGVGYFSGRMQPMLQEVLEIMKQWHLERSGTFSGPTPGPVLVHCWRGGMRSGAIAWLLDLYGFKVYQLKGGYKAYRNWALAQFEKKYRFNILGGFTGSGKTGLLENLRNNGVPTINLEALAHHKGSAFGWLGEKPQPGQEMFENLLAMELYRTSGQMDQVGHPDFLGKEAAGPEIWLEDESRHIGSVGIAQPLWEQMRNSPLYFMDIPFDSRLDHIVENYGRFAVDDLVTSILKIEKRLGGLETRDAIRFLEQGRLRDSLEILLHYYDKLYFKSLNKRENLQKLLNKIPCPTVDTNNIEKLMAKKSAVPS
jgi:tRNA 2-selenouridine synthase